MKNVKKALISTALAGSLVVGAGFGTYSWFTSTAEVSGSIQNATVKLTEIRTGDLIKMVGDYQRLAPSRSAIGEWQVLKNESTDTLNVLEINYQATLKSTDESRGDASDASLRDYKQGAFIYISNTDNLNAFKTIFNWNDPRTELKNAMGNYFDNGVLPSLFTTGITNSAINFHILDNLEAIEDFEDEFFELPDLADWLIFVPTQGEELEGDELDRVNGKLLKVLAKHKYVHLLQGVHLDKDAGNEHQGNEIKVDYNFTLHQIDSDPNEYKRD